jgi:DNA repair protein REV1
MVSQSNSSDYYEEDDSQFLEALGNAILPGDVLPEEESDETKHGDNIGTEEIKPPPSTQPALKRRWSDVQKEEPYPDATNQVSKEEDMYGASRFGGFGDYMRRKRAKLQIQNADIVEDSAKTQIFRGLSIYVSIPVHSCLIPICSFN